MSILCWAAWVMKAIVLPTCEICGGEMGEGNQCDHGVHHVKCCERRKQG